MRTRREALRFLQRALALGAAAAVLPPIAWAQTETWDVRYYDWVADLDEARDQLGNLEEGVLEAADVARLQIVSRPEGGYAVVLRLLGTEAEARALAQAHAVLLAEDAGSDEVLAQPIATGATRCLYNVSYGLGPNFDVLKAQWDTVAGMLGSGVAKALYVERTDHGNFALVYKRYGDVDGTRLAALRHHRLLEGTGVHAALIEERNNEIVWTGSSAAAAAIAQRPRPVEEPEPEKTPEPAPEPVPEPEKIPAPEKVPEPAAEPPSSGFALRSGHTATSAHVNDFIQGLRQRGLVAQDEQTSWLVYDLAADAGVADINGEVPRQAASMIKPLVMLAFFHQVEHGRIVYGDTSRTNLELMIQRSSNSATNWAIDQLGGPERVHALLHEHYGSLLPQTRVVEKIAAGGRTYRNKASAQDYARFLRASWRGQLPRAAEMLRIMNLPGRDRLFYGAPSIPAGTQVYDKTGSTSMLCGDMGILVARRRAGGILPYIVVGIIEKASCTSHYSSWIGARSGVIRQVSDLVYRDLKAAHGLA
ncbi:MAG: serine hydrolase [Pseudomonadota bacterium]